MPKKTGLIGGGLAAALVTTLTLALGGCSMETTAPGSARQDAASDAKGSFGPADCRKAKCIALTFDAGPGKDTPELLDILKEKKVHATFFLLGKNHVVKHPDTVRRIQDEGHEVANHTWTHEILTDREPDEIRAELEKTQVAIEKITGKKPRLMRPPQGRTDDTVSEISKELGLSQVLWSATAKDYSTNDSALITKRILDQAGKDGIILLHDIYKGTVPAVPGIIDALRKDGYTFVTVPELMAPAEPVPGTVYRP
ncbi:polysaccharide deacetylase family protein [Streptomyces microflavus]|uniref:Polysaccharide deacetylase family protein n=1 Tax=Streptomyces microflavus TaxID=1919 RepID=A0A6N9VF21_STRMI|nr:MULTISPECIES: polysaccharide deacetylase family protein [Streptomyces]MBK5992321.1 polysaccharide deacetylase family protein [Streptomyces sp. MBT58]MEE1733866.1 polysaccharide deacetylase family protein [Streptomyces sp. BE282]NEB69878.1 polysaccharide deacetylase family protein [Streptomyces microflavus]QKW45431.1 polysaccharide deacetylase family protein [Streptomyces microflavus]QQZ56452.1 polysaccharide deacetylase family protein [Streptomyces microflavus]